MQQAATWTESLGEDIDGEEAGKESIPTIEQNKLFCISYSLVNK